MEQEKLTEPLTTLQSSLLQQFTGHNTPTHAEILAAQGDIISAHCLANLNCLGYRVDPDVVSILMNVYDDLEINTVPDRDTSYLFAAFLSSSILCTASGAVNMSNGRVDEAFQNWYLSIGMYTVAYAMNAYSKGAHVDRTKKWLEDHWPPVYSNAALQKAREEAFKEGEKESSLRRVKQNLTVAIEHIIPAESDNTEEILEEIRAAQSILQRATNRLLTQKELDFLVLIRNNFSYRHDDLYYAYMSESDQWFLNLLVDEYERREYPVGFVVKKPKAVGS